MKNYFSHAIYCGLFCLFLHTSCFGEFVVTYRKPTPPTDNRELYYAELLRLILDKTTEKYGSYRLEAAPIMTLPRDLSAVNTQAYPNYILIDNIQDKLKNTDITYLEFPVDLGLIGVRICFINPAIKDTIRAAESLNDLKKYTIIQGIGWADNDILRSNGFTVKEVHNYESMFSMIAIGRADLFCRGATEIFPEYDEYKEKYPIIYDESFYLQYPMSRVFMFNKNNTELKNRIEDGLKIILADGTFNRVWDKYNADNVKRANFKNRRVFKLNNPLLKELPKSYSNYLKYPANLP